jgi:hypothetical protein
MIEPRSKRLEVMKENKRKINKLKVGHALV